MARYRTINGMNRPKPEGGSYTYKKYDKEDDEYNAAKRRNAAFDEACKKKETQENHEKHQQGVIANKVRLNNLNEEFKKESAKLSVITEGDVAENDIMKRLKELSAEIDELTVDTKGAYSTAYDRLLEKLALVNPNYIIYVNPLRFTAYDKLAARIDKLDSAHLAQLEAILENSEYGNLFENEGKYQICYSYYRLFKKYLHKLRTIDDIKLYLIKYPDQVKEVKKYLKKLQSEGAVQFGGESIGSILANTLKKSPSSFKYFEYEDILAVANNQPDVLGKVLVKYPEKIKLLPGDFFDKYNPIYIFRSISKAEILQAFKPYLEKFNTSFKKWLLKDLQDVYDEYLKDAKNNEDTDPVSLD